MNNRQPQSKYGDNRAIRTTEDENLTCVEQCLVVLSIFAAVVTFPFSLFFCLIIIPEFKRVVVLRLGRLRKNGVLGPGVVFYLPCIDNTVPVDLRTTSLNVPAQEVLTKDSVTITVDGIVYFRIDNPLKAVLQVKNVRSATEYLAQTTLRTIVGTKMLSELLTSREQLSFEILHALDEATDVWGVKVERVEIKDIRLPVSLQKALAQEAEALREARAKALAAEGEMEASKALKAASDIMKESPLTLQLRYMQTLNDITNDQQSTVIFPVPVDILPPNSSDISLPPELQRSMAAEQEAVRKARAKIAAADGELKAATMLRDASETMSQNPIALQLRYLQTLTNISKPKNHTIVVPFPLDAIRRIWGSSGNSNTQNMNDDKTKPLPPPAPTTSARPPVPNVSTTLYPGLLKKEQNLVEHSPQMKPGTKDVAIQLTDQSSSDF